MKTIDYLILGQTIKLKIPETHEEAVSLIGPDYLKVAAMSYHMRNTIPNARTVIKEHMKKSGQ